MPFDINNYSSPYDNLDYRKVINDAFASQGVAPKYSAEQMAQPAWLPAEQIMTNLWGSVDASPFADTYHAAQAQLPAPTPAPPAPAPLTLTAAPSANAAPPPAPAPGSRDLTPDQLAWLQGQSSQAQALPGIYNGGVYTDPSGQTFTNQITGQWQGGEAGFDGGPGTTTAYLRDVVPGHHQIGDMQDIYGADGTYKNTAAVVGDNLLDKLMPVLLGGFGLAAGAGLLSAGAAGAGAGSGGLAGDVLSKAALDGTTAFGANSVPGAFDLATVGGGAGGAAFNPALDSQLANDWLVSQGVDPLEGYAAAGNGGVTVNPVTNSFANTSTTFNGAKDSQLANEAIEAGAPGFEQFGGNALEGYLTNPYGLPNVNPVINQIVNPSVNAPKLPIERLDPTTVIKIVSAIAAGTPPPPPAPAPPPGGTTQPFDYGPARWGPTGWRDNRPLYVPGQDAIPEGWFGAGHTSH